MSYKWFESVSMNFSAYFVLLGLAALKIWERAGGGVPQDKERGCLAKKSSVPNKPNGAVGRACACSAEGRWFNSCLCQMCFAKTYFVNFCSSVKSSCNWS